MAIDPKSFIASLDLRKSIAEAEPVKLCRCGRELIGFYSQYHEECTRCEDLREGEAYAYQ